MQTLLKTKDSISQDELNSNIKYINSRFGKLEIDLNKNIYFPHGLVGLETYKKFGLVSFPKNPTNNFKILQSFEDDNVSLITYICNLQQVTKYIDNADIEKCSNLFKIPTKDLAIIFITTVHNKPTNDGKIEKKLSINLRAPLIIDTNKNIGIQYIFNNDKYSIQHQL